MTKPLGVVPLDGSATAEAALPWATALARALGLGLVLLKLVPEAWPGGDERAEAALRPARHYLDGVAAALKASGVTIDTLALPVGEDVAAGVIGAAESLDAEIVILATHGWSGPKRWMLGSVADGVVRSAPCPVLVVQALSARRPDFGRIVVPLDGSSPAEAALAAAVRIATATGATLDLIQAVPWSATIYATPPEAWPPSGLDEAMEQAAGDYLRGVLARLTTPGAREHHVLRGSPAQAILEHAESTGAGLIVMGTHGRAGISRFVLGSVADRVVRGGEIPVLLVRGSTTSPSESSEG